MEENDKKTQNMLNKLISDEWFAGQIYYLFPKAVKSEDRNKIAELMIDIAQDELFDHMKNLEKCAMELGLDTPSTYKQMEKYADKDDVKLFENCKKGQDAIFYLDKAIEAEKRAIDTYEKYVDDNELKKLQNLYLVVKNNYYDEIEHLEKFTFAKNQLEAMEQFA